MRKSKKCVAMLLVLTLSLALLAACSAKSETVVTPEPTAAATPAPTLAPTPVPTEEPEAVPVEVTPAMRAAEKGLPEPPDVDVSSWEFKIANSYNNILIYTPPFGNFEGQGIDNRILDITNQLLSDIRAEGLPAYMAAVFRNYEFQNTYYAQKVRELGDAYEASKLIVGPGCNEHQTGLCFDISADPSMSINYSIFDNTAVLETKTYQWMLDNCTDYGFILRYPEGKEQYYGTPCTAGAGHFRYVGVEAAKYITENNLCLEEFLLLYDEDIVYVPGIN